MSTCPLGNGISASGAMLAIRVYGLAALAKKLAIKVYIVEKLRRYNQLGQSPQVHTKMRVVYSQKSETTIITDVSF